MRTKPRWSQRPRALPTAPRGGLQPLGGEHLTAPLFLSGAGRYLGERRTWKHGWGNSHSPSGSVGSLAFSMGKRPLNELPRLVAGLSLPLGNTGVGISSTWRARRDIPCVRGCRGRLGVPLLTLTWQVAGGVMNSEGSGCGLRPKSLGLRQRTEAGQQ